MKPFCQWCKSDQHRSEACPKIVPSLAAPRLVRPEAPVAQSPAVAKPPRADRRELFRKLGKKRWEGKTDDEKLAHSEMMIRKLQEKLGG